MKINIENFEFVMDNNTITIFENSVFGIDKVDEFFGLMPMNKDTFEKWAKSYFDRLHM